MKKSRLWIALGLTGMFGLSSLALAQDASERAAAETEAAVLDQVVVVGSRRVDRSDTDTAVPVDVLQLDKAVESSPQFDLAQTLQFLAPSFNSTRQTGADGADLIDSAALRGLGSDQTLVLVNGKRKHSTALVNLFGARNRGNTGTDLNTIPVLAIDRVEVLRDGAAAQYGSDAIAGVMNIALKSKPGCEVVLAAGQYSAGDGENYLGSSYCGFEVGERGYISITGEYAERGRSDRSEADNPRIIGDSQVENKTIYLNGNLPFGEGGEFYFTGGYQDRDASSAAFGRGGLGSDDIPSRNSAAIYPNGFVPFIDGELEDRFVTVGARHDVGEWHADLSTTYGYNDLLYTINNTLNASIANRDLLTGGRGLSPTSFDAGGFSFSQNTTNLDFSRYFGDYLNGLNIAFGLERRTENFEIFAGESGSFVDADGAGGGNAGSQGFPGFQPGDETDSNRHSWAVYSDFEAEMTESVTVNLATRYEDYSDFGNTLDGKLALAFRANDYWTVRGSLSTGFRAPSLQQRFLSSTFTDFISGRPVDVLLAPNGGTVANAAGIPALTEETSLGYTLGFTARPTDYLSLTIDAYRIDIDDRIVLSGRLDNSDPSIGAILDRLGVGQAQFFVNSVDTETQGLDLTATLENEVGEGQLLSTLAFNYNQTEVQRIKAPSSLVGREDVLLSERERLFIEQGAPRRKAIVGFDYTRAAWSGNLKFIYFGSQTLGTFSGLPVPNAEYRPGVSTDLSLSYSVTENTKLTVGGANIFDKTPSRQDDLETDNGFIYDSVQFGLNGASVYLRLYSKF